MKNRVDDFCQKSCQLTLNEIVGESFFIIVVQLTALIKAIVAAFAHIAFLGALSQDLCDELVDFSIKLFEITWNQLKMNARREKNLTMNDQGRWFYCYLK